MDVVTLFMFPSTIKWAYISSIAVSVVLPMFQIELTHLLSQVTRGLRARLSYASFKATHNIPHIPLRDLEAQSQSHYQTATSRIIGAKRKASGTNNYYNNPATQGVHNPPTPRKGSMAPPALTSSATRSYYPSTSASTGNGRPHPHTNAPQTQSLYSSILAPPPAKQARTIHNPRDPPVPAPTRPPATPRSRRGSKAAEQAPAATGRARALSLAEGTRSHAKSRRDDPVGKAKRATHKGKQKARGTGSLDLTQDSADMDLKAAATLTSLLLQSRPAMTASTTSPRSSVSAGGSDAGSSQSFSHFAQSSARTMTTAPSSQQTNVVSADSSFSVRSITPPPIGSQPSMVGTPRARAATISGQAPSDSEAADLMLFLATSPSPVRPTINRDRDKDTQDGLGPYRALGGGEGLRAKGRVLFAGAGGASGSGNGLIREGSIGSSNGDVSMSELPHRLDLGLSINTADGGAGLMQANIIPPTPVEVSAPAVPPPSSPSLVAKDTTPKPQLHPSPAPVGGLPFNLNDFIHTSPLPPTNGTPFKSGSGVGMRADMGRRLFEDMHSHSHQHHQMQGVEHQSRTGAGLGAGIDLMK